MIFFFLCDSQGGIQTFGGGNRTSDQRCFYYGGPQQQQRIFDGKPPTFESLTKNRMLKEERFYINNSNTKYLTMGLVPASKILDENARGFYFEAYLCGEKNAPLPLGGLQGMAALFETIREIPEFSKVPRCPSGIERSNNILISTVKFADDVSILIF